MNTANEISPKEKETHVRVIFMNALFIIGCALIMEFFVVSNYDSISEKADTANAATEKVEKYKSQGVTFDEYKRLINTYTAKKASFDETDADLFSEALKKDQNSPLDYISWVEGEVSSGSIIRYDTVEQKNSAIIGSILPTLGESSDTSALGDIQKNIVTLPTLSRYIEESILKKYTLDSTSPISIGDITYDTTKNSATSIGSFVINFDVKGRNSNIIAAIAAIQDSGKLTVENGELVTPNPANGDNTYSSLSNLLIGIDSIDTKNALARDDSLNTATLKLRFYVKGRSYGSYLEIKGKVVEKYTALSNKITAALSKFKSQPPKTNAQMDAVSDIRNLSAQIKSISSKIDEIQKAGKVTEFAGQFDNILSTYASLAAIESRFEKDNAALN